MQYFHRKAITDTKKVTVIFLGWACEYNQFARLISDEDFQDKDLLFVWDYRDFKLDYDFTGYKEINVLAFSYGVFAASKTQLPYVKTATAINGTPYPISKEYGIPPKIFDLTLKNLSEDTLTRFYKNMFTTNDEYEKFASRMQQSTPQRISELRDELINIQKESALNTTRTIEFSKAIISTKDKIFPPKAQYNYWTNRVQIVDIETGHYPFLEHNFMRFI